jgi:hypothetical protein
MKPCFANYFFYSYIKLKERRPYLNLAGAFVFKAVKYKWRDNGAILQKYSPLLSRGPFLKKWMPP